jgi:hypothetical protein
MISTDLINISDFVLGHAAKGKPMDPACTAQLAHVLFDLGQQVRHLERMPVDLSDATLAMEYEEHDAL